jgi:hypothetical protein
MRNLDLAAVTVGDAAFACEMSAGKLSSLINMRIVRFSIRDKAASGSGDRRVLSIRTCHAAALVAQLVQMGFRHPVAGAIARRAVAEPALYGGQAYVVKRGPDAAVEVLAEFPASGRIAVVIDATAVLRDFDERLAARVPELRSAGIV